MRRARGLAQISLRPQIIRRFDYGAPPAPPVPTPPTGAPAAPAPDVAPAAPPLPAPPRSPQGAPGSPKNGAESTQPRPSLPSAKPLIATLSTNTPHVPVSARQQPGKGSSEIIVVPMGIIAPGGI